MRNLNITFANTFTAIKKYALNQIKACLETKKKLILWIWEGSLRCILHFVVIKIRNIKKPCKHPECVEVSLSFPHPGSEKSDADCLLLLQKPVNHLINTGAPAADAWFELVTKQFLAIMLLWKNGNTFGNFTQMSHNDSLEALPITKIQTVAFNIS